jgi:hypothetical protein
MSSRHGFPQCMRCINIHELHKDVSRITLASLSLNIDIRHLHVRVFDVRQEKSRRGHRHRETRAPETDMTWPGIEPGHP